MLTLRELSEKGRILSPQTKAPDTGSPQSSFVGGANALPLDAKATPMAEYPPPNRTQIPDLHLSLECWPLSAYDDNPVLNENGASILLGVSEECMKKWRQRDQGPDYLQYGRGGPVRYERDALMEFRAVHRVKVSRKP